MEAKWLVVSLKPQHVQVAVAAAARLGTDGQKAKWTLLKREPVGGNYRLGAAEVEAILGVLSEMTGKDARATAKRFRQAKPPLPLNDAGKRPEDRQGALTDVSGASGERKRARRQTGQPRRH